ncbi:radical SAM protein [candidate division FCPU426 bacterium]|nr:radical SAM protein [candidate division FCPU426 bacterium]
MNPAERKHIYGPVPSRRLGRSLGLDLVPYKICTYDCIYCQLGRTTHKTMERKAYVPADDVLRDLEEFLRKGGRPDYISLSGSGEPTLNADTGRLIAGIKQLTDIPVAVITNGSLLWMEEVQEELAQADLILPSLDAGDENIFQTVNRPHPELSFMRVAEGLAVFSRHYSGMVWLEVFLCAGVTDDPEQVGRIAEWAEIIHPQRIQLNTVVRPPAESQAMAVTGEKMTAAKALFAGDVDIIAGTENQAPEGHAARTLDDEAVLSLLHRRPCTPNDVAKGLDMHVNEAVKHLHHLLKAGKIRTVAKNEVMFYVPAARE